MEKILRDTGADRVGRDAKEALRDYVEEHAAELSDIALTYTEHAGRTTVKAEDIHSAAEMDD